MPRRPLRWIIQKSRSRWRELMQTKHTFRLTAEGVVFIVVTLMIGLAAMNTSAQLLFLVFAMMCSFWMLSAILATASLRRVQAFRRAPRLVSAGQPVRVRLWVVNHKRWNSSFSLRVTDHLDDQSPIGAAFFMRVPRHAEERSEYECVFPRRGQYTFSRVVLATRFPFGLIERSVVRATPWDLLVLPASIPVDEILRAARVDLGDNESHLKGRGSALYGLREYVEGESARDIHWRVSARTGKLMVREFENEERRRASIILDNRLPSGGDPEALEKALILANSVLIYLVQRGHQVELLTSSGKVAFGSGPQHLLRCQRSLAMLPVESLAEGAPHPHDPEADSVQFLIEYHAKAKRSTSPDAIVLNVHEYESELSTALESSPPPADVPLPGIEYLKLDDAPVRKGVVA